jgi:hypothetical protein
MQSASRERASPSAKIHIHIHSLNLNTHALQSVWYVPGQKMQGASLLRHFHFPRHQATKVIVTIGRDAGREPLFSFKNQKSTSPKAEG